jgi:hypothetical protein
MAGTSLADNNLARCPPKGEGRPANAAVADWRTWRSVVTWPPPEEAWITERFASADEVTPAAGDRMVPIMGFLRDEMLGPSILTAS